MQKKSDAILFQANFILEEENEKEHREFTKLTFTEYMRDWLNSYAKIYCEKTTYDGYKVIIEKYLVPYFGSKLLRDLKPFDIQNYYDYLILYGRKKGEGGLTPSTLKNTIM